MKAPIFGLILALIVFIIIGILFAVYSIRGSCPQFTVEHDGVDVTLPESPEGKRVNLKYENSGIEDEYQCIKSLHWAKIPEAGAAK